MGFRPWRVKETVLDEWDQFRMLCHGRRRGRGVFCDGRSSEQGSVVGEATQRCWVGSVVGEATQRCWVVFYGVGHGYLALEGRGGDCCSGTIFYWLFGSLEGDVVGLAKVHNTVDEGVYLFEAGDTAVQ